MIKISCNIKGESQSCDWYDKQTLEHCFNCMHLQQENDLVFKADDKAIKLPVMSLYGNIDRHKELQDTTKAARFNEGKPQWSLVHFKSLEPMVRVLEYGCLKYAPFNWQKPMDTRKILESMQRHLAALFDGEEVDEESGLSHMGHIMCNALFFNYHKDKENGKIKS